MGADGSTKLYAREAERGNDSTEDKSLMNLGLSTWEGVFHAL